MKITFDSNTWRQIASPDKFPKDSGKADYRIIREAINNKQIIPFISETVFTLEAIRRKDRKQFFRDYKAVFDTNIVETADGRIKMEFKIGPNRNAHPGNNSFLKEHFADAVSLGFNVINLPRIAGITNPDIEAAKYLMDNDTLSKYMEKVFEVHSTIFGMEAGDYEIMQIAKKYDPKGGLHGCGEAPDSENEAIAKAVAEWADGDSIACHIAVGGDFFCTNDRAKSGGAKSVLSEKNLKILKELYSFEVLSPADLAILLKNKSRQ